MSEQMVADGHRQAALTIRTVDVAEVGKCVQIEGASFSIVLTRAQAQDIAVTILRMAG